MTQSLDMAHKLIQVILPNYRFSLTQNCDHPQTYVGYPTYNLCLILYLHFILYTTNWSALQFYLQKPESLRAQIKGSNFPLNQYFHTIELESIILSGARRCHLMRNQKASFCTILKGITSRVLVSQSAKRCWLYSILQGFELAQYRKVLFLHNTIRY